MCKESLPWQSSRRVVLKYISFKLGYNFNSCCYSVFSTDFSIPIPGGFLTLYILFWLILALHLLIMQATT